MNGLFMWLLEWKERRRILREARKLDEMTNAQLAFDERSPVNLAAAALRVGEHDKALKYWRMATDRCPAFAKKHNGSLDILLRLKLFDEADVIMRENIKCFPRDPFYAAGYAQIAQERHDFVEAVKRWRVVVKRYQGDWEARISYAVCLRETGELSAADKFLEKTVQSAPDKVLPRIEWARNAEYRKDFTTALVRWQDVWDKFKHMAGDVGVSECLGHLGRFDEAEARLKEVRMRWPLAEQVRIALARVAQQRGDTEEALRRWDDLRVSMPLLRFGYVGQIHLLRSLGRFDEADAITQTAKERFPHESWPDSELRTTEQGRKSAVRADDQSATAP